MVRLEGDTFQFMKLPPHTYIFHEVMDRRQWCRGQVVVVQVNLNVVQMKKTKQ